MCQRLEVHVAKSNRNAAHCSNWIWAIRTPFQDDISAQGQTHAAVAEWHLLFKVVRLLHLHKANSIRTADLWCCYARGLCSRRE